MSSNRKGLLQDLARSLSPAGAYPRWPPVPRPGERADDAPSRCSVSAAKSVWGREVARTRPKTMSGTRRVAPN